MYSKNSPPQPIFDDFQLKVFESHQKVKRLVFDLSNDKNLCDYEALKKEDFIFKKYEYITVKDLHRSNRSLQSIIEEVMTKRIVKKALSQGISHNTISHTTRTV